MENGYMTFTFGEMAIIVGGLASFAVFLWGGYRFVESKISKVEERAERALTKCRETMDAKVDGVDKRVTDLKDNVHDEFLHKDHFAETFTQITIQLGNLTTAVTGVHERIDKLYQYMVQDKGNGTG